MFRTKASVSLCKKFAWRTSRGENKKAWSLLRFWNTLKWKMFLAMPFNSLKQKHCSAFLSARLNHSSVCIRGTSFYNIIAAIKCLSEKINKVERSDPQLLVCSSLKSIRTLWALVHLVAFQLQMLVYFTLTQEVSSVNCNHYDPLFTISFYLWKFETSSVLLYSVTASRLEVINFTST